MRKFNEICKELDDKEAQKLLEESYNDRHVPPWAIKLILGPEDIQMGGLDHEH